MLMTGSGGLLNLAVAVLTAGPVAVGGARPPAESTASGAGCRSGAGCAPLPVLPVLVVAMLLAALPADERRFALRR